jgi:mono/diheme cytochrome c family protein
MLSILTLLFSMAAMAEEPGRPLFEARCATCHQLPEPDMLNPKQWRMVMQTMQKRLSQNDLPPLTDEEFSQVLSYLTQQAGE